MTRRRWLATLLLAIAAVLSGVLVYQLRRPGQPVPMTGPPRSDYMLEQFTLVALDEDGEEAFTLEGPRLARHPFLGTLDIEQPRLRMPDEAGALWTARAQTAHVDGDADLVRLARDVVLQGPPPEVAGGQPIRLVTESLDYHPRRNELTSPAAVTITSTGSILRGRDLFADLDSRRFDLAELNGRYETNR